MKMQQDQDSYVAAMFWAISEDTGLLAFSVFINVIRNIGIFLIDTQVSSVNSITLDD